MAFDDIGFGILTGTDPYRREDGEIKDAVADRFLLLRDKLVKRSGDYVYDGNRCAAASLGWRLIQNCQIGFSAKKGTIITVEKIAEGLLDTEIEETWHEAASAEHYYTYEKDWGYGPGM